VVMPFASDPESRPYGKQKAAPMLRRPKWTRLQSAASRAGRIQNRAADHRPSLFSRLRPRANCFLFLR
jgi:hypothetical protein